MKIIGLLLAVGLVTLFPLSFSQHTTPVPVQVTAAWADEMPAPPPPEIPSDAIYGTPDTPNVGDGATGYYYFDGYKLCFWITVSLIEQWVYRNFQWLEGTI